jgi:class 3 adenylate cyclase/dihydrofolate reductase
MRLVVTEFMTLDGVMEAPGLEEHRSGRNGWAMMITDDLLQAFNLAQVEGADALLFGRTTYNIWAAFWPTPPDVAADIGRQINALPKYVVSRTLRDPDWENTVVLRGNLEDEIRRIKELPGREIVTYGSADLVGGLLELDLVDELRVVLFPVILGGGKRLFREEAELRHLRLVSAEPTPAGAVLLRYERQEAPTPPRDLAAYQWTPEQVRSFRALEEMDRVLATVVFTDIVDSTGRAAALGDRDWRRLLDRYEENARAEVKRWGGQFVKSTGDGMLARFDSPSRAVRAGLALGAAARRQGVEIRVAVHTGEVEVRGDDLGGIGVHIASRVLAEAGPGQVLVTRTVRDLATGTDVELRPIGEVGLRGVPGTWELFEAKQR